MKDIYSILLENEVITSYSLREIEKKAVYLARKRRTGKVMLNGIEIGWIGEDLSERIGWGYFIKVS